VVNWARIGVGVLLGALLLAGALPAFAQAYTPPAHLTGTVYMCTNCTGVALPTDPGTYRVYRIKANFGFSDMGDFAAGAVVNVAGDWNYDLRYSFTPQDPDPNLSVAEGVPLAILGALLAFAAFSGFAAARYFT